MDLYPGHKHNDLTGCDLNPEKIDWHFLEEEAATYEVGPRASELFPVSTTKVQITGQRQKLKAVALCG